LKVGRLLPPIVPVLIAIAVDDRGARWGARFTDIILFLSRNNIEILPFHQSLTISLL
jgi:alkanesulfonate monooxygenase SsuD/methylene tetrahydromethanopterin reductase-like flavin-dependent oxidoreductase (luciferase family)